MRGAPRVILAAMKIFDDGRVAREARTRRVAQLSRLALAITIGISCGAARGARANPAARAERAAPADSARALSYAERSCLPEWAARALERGDVAAHHAASAWLNPFTLRGDFDGDGLADCAVTARETGSGKRGILVVHRGDLAVHVLGAGEEIGAGGDDFAWMDAWRVRERSDAERIGTRDALWVAKTESASALIWWNGARYVWSQEGD